MLCFYALSLVQSVYIYILWIDNKIIIMQEKMSKYFVEDTFDLFKAFLEVCNQMCYLL